MKAKKMLFKITLISSIFFSGFVIKEDNNFTDLKIQFVENEYPQYIDSLAILNDCSLLLEYSKSRETVDINTKLLEDSINDIDYVYNAEVYLRDGSLNILIEQNIPFLRFEELGNFYYLNREGGQMLATEMNLADVLFFSGDTIRKKEICALADIIYEDFFMNSLIKGVHYDNKLGYVFYPRLFDIEIVFGDTLGSKKKFEKIKTFYQKLSRNSNVVDVYGNLQIKTVDVTYENQIICSKKN